MPASDVFLCWKHNTWIKKNADVTTTQVTKKTVNPNNLFIIYEKSKKKLQKGRIYFSRKDVSLWSKSTRTFPIPSFAKCCYIEAKSRLVSIFDLKTFFPSWFQLPVNPPLASSLSGWSQLSVNPFLASSLSTHFWPLASQAGPSSVWTHFWPLPFLFLPYSVFS